MFQNWGFLITEISVLIIAAALLGLLAGALIWSGRRPDARLEDHTEAVRLKREAKAHAEEIANRDRRIAELEAALETTRRKPESAAETEPKPTLPRKPAPQKDNSSQEKMAEDLPVGEVGRRPEALSTPRDNAPDDLTRIKGIGPKLAALCNHLGFFHFDQIASWTADEIAWVDANLEDFKGRVTRDNWVAQAKMLAAQDDPGT